MVFRASLMFAIGLLTLSLSSSKSAAQMPMPGGDFGKAPPRLKLVVQTGHFVNVSSVSLSADGKYVLTGSWDGTAILWEAATGKKVQTFQGHAKGVSSVALSSDGKRVLTGSWDETAILWEAATGKKVQTFQGHKDSVTSVALSSDGKRVLTGSEDKTAILWDAATGKKVQTFQMPNHWVTSVALSSDGNRVLTGSRDTTAILWDAATGKKVQTFQGHTEIVWSVALSSDGKRVLTGSWDKTAILWEAATGKKVQTFQGHAEGITSVALSSDGKRVLTGSWDGTAILWDAATGKKVQTFQGHKDSVKSVALSSDGKRVLTGSWDHTAILWETVTGRKVQTFERHTEIVWSVALSSDGNRVLIGSEDDTAILWDGATGKKMQTFQGHKDSVKSVALSSDGKRVLTGSSDKTAILWDGATGKKVQTFQGHKDSVKSVALSSDGKRVLTGSSDKTAILWDGATGKKVQTFQGHAGGVTSVALSADGKRVLTGSWDETAILWEAATGKKVQTFQGHTKGVTSVALSSDGNRVLTGSWDGTAILWEAATGKKVQTFQGHAEGITSVALSSDGKRVLTGSWDKTAILWDAATGKKVQTFQGHNDWVTSVALSADGKRVLTGSWDGTAILWDAATGKKLQKGHAEGITSVALSADGKHVGSAHRDGTTRLWDLATGKERCSLVSFHDGTWAVVDPEGRYDASNGGDVEGMHWVVGLEPIALKQLKERYYVPGLLALHMNNLPLPTVEGFKDIKLHPEVEAEAPKAGETKLAMKLINRGGGIGKVQVFVNGRELLADARGGKVASDAATAKLTVDLSGAPVLPGEKTPVSIVTWNADGRIAHRGLVLEWEPPGKKETAPIEMYAIVAGVSKYDNKELNLSFSSKDAEDMATALTLAGERLFPGRVHLTLLCDSDNKGVLAPTRANLEKTFEQVRKQAKPTDILVVFLAGHGVALQDEGGSEVYCYLTKEARTTNQEALRDKVLRRQFAVTSTELTEWIKEIKALKQVLILDTCAAGAAASKLMEKRNLSADQIRAIDRMRDRTGFHVLMGCSADRVSYEASRYSQGLLTHSLLKGMRGAKLRANEYVDVSDLFRYAEDEVETLARDVGGTQKPLVLAPKGNTFDIGQLKDDDKKRIPLAMVRPLVLRPRLQNADLLRDNLKLEPRLREQLAKESQIQARGQSPKLVFVDADEMFGAVRPSGTYTVVGKKVTVRLVLEQDEKEIARLSIEGGSEELPSLVAAAITKKLAEP